MIFGPTILETLHSSGSNLCHVLNIPEAVGVFLPIKQYCNMQVLLSLSGCMQPIKVLFSPMNPSWFYLKVYLGAGITQFAYRLCYGFCDRRAIFNSWQEQ